MCTYLFTLEADKQQGLVELDGKSHYNGMLVVLVPAVSTFIAVLHDTASIIASVDAVINCYRGNIYIVFIASWPFFFC